MTELFHDKKEKISKVKIWEKKLKKPEQSMRLVEQLQWLYKTKDLSTTVQTVHNRLIKYTRTKILKTLIWRPLVRNILAGFHNSTIRTVRKKITHNKVRKNYTWRSEKTTVISRNKNAQQFERGAPLYKNIVKIVSLKLWYSHAYLLGRSSKSSMMVV